MGATVRARRCVLPRRVVLGALVGAAMLGASGCGFDDRRLVRACEEAVAAVDVVRAVEFEARTGAEFKQSLVGVIELDAAGRSEVIAAYDRAMRAFVTVIHDEYDDLAGDRVMGAVVGRGTDGAEIDPRVLLTLKPGEQMPRLDAIAASSFYARYGLA